MNMHCVITASDSENKLILILLYGVIHMHDSVFAQNRLFANNSGKL